MRIGTVLAARMASSRLPGKALLPLSGMPLVVFLLHRLKGSQLSDTLLLATSDLPGDDELARVVTDQGVAVFRGSHEDVVARYVGAAREYELDWVVRVTGDCPFLDARTLDHCLRQCKEAGDFDIATTKGVWPVGIDYEIYPAALMERLHREGGLDAEEREHLTLRLYRQPKYRILHLQPPFEAPALGHPFTVDTAEDYQRARNLADRFEDILFGVEDILEAAAYAGQVR